MPVQRGKEKAGQDHGEKRTDIAFADGIKVTAENNFLRHRCDHNGHCHHPPTVARRLRILQKLNHLLRVQLAAGDTVDHGLYQHEDRIRSAQGEKRSTEHRKKLFPADPEYAGRRDIPVDEQTDQKNDHGHVDCRPADHVTEIQCLLTGCGQRFIAQKSKPCGEKRGHKAIEAAHPIVLHPAALRDEHTMRQR